MKETSVVVIIFLVSNNIILGTGQLPGSVDYRMRCKQNVEEDEAARRDLLSQSQPSTQMSFLLHYQKETYVLFVSYIKV